MKQIKNLEIKNIFFLIILVSISIVTAKIFLPYINIIIISLVIVQLFYPIYKFLVNRSGSKVLSVTVSVLVALLLFIIPITIIILLTFNEIQNIAKTNGIINILDSLEKTINNIINSINSVSSQNSIVLSNIQLRDVALQLANNVKGELLPITQQILSFSGEILFNAFLLILCLVYFFPIYDQLPRYFRYISPLDDKLDNILFKKFTDTTKGVIRGSFIVAILQATAVAIPLFLLGIGAPVLMWIIMFILSLVPVGSGLVWGPIGLTLVIDGFSTGNSSKVILGIALIIYSAIIINVIDTTFRPRLIKDTVNLHPLVTIFSVLGGIYFFGVLGVLYGPLIVVFFLSIMQIYRLEYLNHEEIKT